MVLQRVLESAFPFWRSCFAAAASRETSHLCLMVEAQNPVWTKALEMLRVLVKEQPDAILAELCDEINEQRGIRVSAPTMCTALKKLGLGRKKVPPRHRARQTGGPEEARGFQEGDVSD